MLHLTAVAACFAMGFALVSASGGRRDPLLACALAFPLGAATSMLLAAAFVVLYLPLAPATYGVVWAAVLAAAVWRGCRAPGGRWSWWCAALVLLLVVVALAAWRWSVAVMEPRSYGTLLLGRVAAGGVLVPDAALPPGGDHGFALYAPFFLVSRALPLALMPLIGVSGIALVAIAIARSMPESRARTLVVAAVVALLATSPALARLFVTVGSPGAAGVMLVAFAVIWREREATGDARAIALALIGLGGFALHGDAHAVTACATVLLVAATSRLPRWSLVAPVGAFLFLATLYLAVGSGFAVSPHVEARGDLGRMLTRQRWWPLSGAILVTTVAAVVRRSSALDLRLLAVGFVALVMPPLLAGDGEGKVAALAGLGTSVLLLLLTAVCGAAGAPRSLERVSGAEPPRIFAGRRGLVAAGFIVLMTVTLFSNLRQLAPGQLDLKPSHRITAQSIEPDLHEMAEHATKTVRYRDALYYLVRDSAPGVVLHLPVEFDTHAYYLETIAAVDVRLVPHIPSLAPEATDGLSQLAAESLSVARSDGTTVPMLFLFVPGEREYVVARDSRPGAPFLWLPVTSFRANGGVL